MGESSPDQSDLTNLIHGLSNTYNFIAWIVIKQLVGGGFVSHDCVNVIYKFII